MKLFHWNRSETLERYGYGDIIVMAHDVGCARIIAFDRFIEWINTPDTSMHYKVEFSHLWDEDDKADYKKLLDQFNADLDREPLDIDGAIFIMGSE